MLYLFGSPQDKSVNFFIYIISDCAHWRNSQSSFVLCKEFAWPRTKRIIVWGSTSPSPNPRRLKKIFFVAAAAVAAKAGARDISHWPLEKKGEGRSKKCYFQRNKNIFFSLFPGVDFQFEVIMSILFFLEIDLDESDEVIFVLKCLTVSSLILIIGLILKSLNITQK